MRNLKQLFCILILVSVFAACKKDPTACFTINTTSAPVNTLIKCDASCSKNVKEYIWLQTGLGYSAGNTSLDTITYKFDVPGNYLIKLQVTNGRKENIIAHTVTIY